MNLIADESVDQPIVERLRTAGHSVTAIAELGPSDKGLRVVAALAVHGERVGRRFSVLNRRTLRIRALPTWTAG